MEHELAALMLGVDRVEARRVHLVVQAGLVLVEASEADSLADEIEKLVESRAAFFVVVHLLLGRLAGLAVEDAHLVVVRQALLVKFEQLLFRRRAGDGQPQAGQMDFRRDHIEHLA